ncbi:MAG: DUF2723 domain-containing protein [Bacteroidales bacterium]
MDLKNSYHKLKPNIMPDYKKINIAAGWLVFIIAASVYFMTLEPTASWWDCSERITAAYKMEVPHPPGAPFFILMGRIFTMLAPDPSLAALFMNAMSALAAAFTVMLLFWIITHLGRKIISPGSVPNKGQTLALTGSALVGALAFSVSDTHWFVAVESEAYATSGLFTALVFWAILKWENVADRKYSASWLILITYLMGLSIGVHLLNLLAIPAIVFVYYFRKYPVTRKGIIYAAMVSVLLLGFFVYIILPGVIRAASAFELVFVNSFGLPYHSGVLFFIVAAGTLLTWGLYYTHKKKKPVLNTIILGLTMVLIGYSSYTVVVIRSSAEPPMDQNSPNNVFNLISYLAREQYGTSPLFYGQYYSAPQTDVTEGRMQYIMEDGRYVETNPRMEAEYHPEFTGFFPRMWSSSNPAHIREYEQWGMVKGRQVRVTIDGETQMIVRPTFAENIRFFLRYQVWHMYGRYFMWNFVGRQNDIQGHGELLNGNWLSGINFIDALRLGPQDNLPGHIASHPARNTYYGLPLVLGLLGFFYHYKKDKKDFTIVLLLFFFTGLAIIIYLNQHPLQPRERDYTYAGSFLAFSIWIGLGVLALIEWMQKKIPLSISSIAATAATFLLVPVLMASENRDDHDRSGRFTARDFAFNYLNSCEPDAILFTHGDNDTFPLWYAQEVEGVRTDVRVVNLMLLNAGWYIEQMKEKKNDSPPVPFSLQRKKYVDGTNNLIYMVERFDEHINVKQLIDFVADDSDRSKLRVSGGRQIDYIPAKKFRVEVDADMMIEKGIVSPGLKDEIVESIDWEIDENYLVKNQMMVLDLLANNNWERPVYFVSGGTEDAMGLEEYFQLEGFAYRLVPIRTEGDEFEYGRINTDVMYDNFMNNFSWGRMNEPDVHLCHYNIRTLSILRLRNKFARLANALTEQNKPDSAVMVLDRCMELMPPDKVPYEFMILSVAEAYYIAGAEEKGNELLEDYFDFVASEMSYYLSFPERLAVSLDRDKRTALQLMNEMVRMAGAFDQDELSENLRVIFESFMDNMMMMQD